VISKNVRDVLPAFLLTYEAIHDRCCSLQTIRDSFEATGQMPPSMEQALNQRRRTALLGATKKIILDFLPQLVACAKNTGQVSYELLKQLYAKFDPAEGLLLPADRAD
jgi:hypothetical protein